MFKLIKPILFACLMMTSLHPQAQKLKYKDIFALIEAKDYESAIPMLKSYMSEEKGASNPSANLQMGLYYEGKVGNYHLINDSTAILAAADSSLTYLLKAKELINEKELKKNDEYYQAYYRRDLRSGEFAVKLSDVQLDMEKKIEAMNGIVNKANQIYGNLFRINKDYIFCRDLYIQIVNRFGEERVYLRGAEEAQLDTLDMVIIKMSDIRSSFRELREAVSVTGVKGYSPELTMNPIREFGKDGMSETDFFVNDVEAWDYGSWAETTYKKIKRDVLPLKASLVEFNQKLISEQESMAGLSTITYESLTKAIDPLLLKKMKEYDDNPLPEKIFNLQININQYELITKPIQNPKIEDEEDIDYQLSISDSLLSILDTIAFNASALVDPYVSEANKNYPALIKEEYGGDFGLIKHRQKIESFVEKAREKWQEKNEIYRVKSLWGINPDGSDSLYLAPRSEEEYATRYLGDYYTVAAFKDESANIYVIGMEFKGSVDKGFIARVNKSRVIEWKENFSLKGFTYFKSDLMIFGEFIPSQEGVVSAYLFSVTEKPSKNLMAVSSTLNGEIKWVNPILAPRKPIEVKLNDIVKETIFYFVAEDEIETAPADETAYIVIDRAGNVR